jgi:hypothetical protein
MAARLSIVKTGGNKYTVYGADGTPSASKLTKNEAFALLSELQESDRLQRIAK